MKTFYPTFLLCLLSGFLFEAHALTIYVDSSATGTDDGTNWENAYTGLQDAIANANAGDEIWVAAGAYFPGEPGSSPSVTFLIEKNITLLGGFDGTETSVDQRNPMANETILSGDLNGDDEPGNFDINKSDNVWHVVRVAEAVGNDAVIDGFTIQGGYADGGGLFAGARGENNSITITNSGFLNNSANNAFGGGALVWMLGEASWGDVWIDSCLFEGNTSANGSGGLDIGSLPKNVNTPTSIALYHYELSISQQRS